MNTNSKPSKSKWFSVWVYFAMAYGVSWLIEIALALSGVSMEAVSGPVLLSFAVLGQRQPPLVLPISRKTKWED